MSNDTPRQPSSGLVAGAASDGELRLRLATEALGVGIFEVVDGVAVWENRRIYDIFGRDPSQGPVSPEAFLTSVLHPDDVQPLIAAFSAAEAGKTLTVPGRIRRENDGAWRHLEFTTLPGNTEDGRRRTVGVVVDVSEREMAQRRVRESEARFRLLFDAMPAGALIVDADGCVCSGNDTAANLFGVSLDSLPGLRLADRVIEPTAEALSRRVASVLADGGRHVWQSRYRRGDGGTVDLLVSVCRVEVDGHARVMAVVADQSAQKAAEHELRLNQVHTNLALEAGRMGAWRWNVDEPTVHWSESLYRLLELEPGTGIESPERFMAMVVEEDRQRVQAALEDIFADGRFHASDHRLLCGDGVTRWMSGHGRVLMDSAGRPRTIVGVVADITEIKRLEMSLREADRRKDQFLAVLGHELRNPLTPLSNAAVALQHGPDSIRCRELGAMIERQTRHLARLVDDLAEAAEVTTGRITLRPAPTAVAPVLDAAIEATRSTLAAAGQSLIVQRDGTPGSFMADETRLAQILINLLHNASKFSPSGSAISLVVREADDFIHWIVEDPGIGIDASAGDQIFDLFVQAPQGEAPVKHGGLGVGLALVKALSQLHGGGVTMTSAGKGRGCRFEVCIPRRPAPAP